MGTKELIKLLRWKRYKEAEDMADLFNSLGLFVSEYVAPGEQKRAALHHLMEAREAATKAIINPYE